MRSPGRCTGRLLLLSVLSTARLCSQAGDTLVILHTSDTHVVYSPSEFHPVFAKTLTGSRGSADSLRRFFTATTKEQQADAVVITGDILACFESQTRSAGMFACQVEQLRSLYDECPVPLYLTLGNHDISSYSVHEMDSTLVTSQTNAARARASWIRNIPCFYDGTYYTRIFQVGKVRYHFIFLDDGYSLRDGSRRLDKTQLDWLNEQMRKAGDEPVLLFHHIYFSIGDVNNDGVFFNRNKPVDWPSEEQCSEGFLKVVNEHPNIKALVVGHGHSNVFEKIRFPSGHAVYQIETGSVNEGRDNWRTFRCTENEIFVSAPGSKKAEVTIKLHGKGTGNAGNQ